MILRIEDLKDVCSLVSQALDTNKISSVTEILELQVDNNMLYMKITNGEYFTQIKLPVQTENESMHATVKADLFLKLIAQTTKETVEFEVKDTNLVVKGNGTYKLPLIFNDSTLATVPEISINNITVDFNIPGEVLNSIYKYNTKQLGVGAISRPIQKFYYVDESGCLTFTSGACVNSFTLPQPVKMLLNQKLVKLFNLFKGSNVHFQLGYDALTEEIVQTKVKFETDNILVVSILSCDDTMLNSVPVAAIRDRAQKMYNYSVVLNKSDLVETINRLLLFNLDNNITVYGMFDFGPECVVISDKKKENVETLRYMSSGTIITDNYCGILDLNELKATLDTCNEDLISLNFGDDQAFVIKRGTVYNVIPQCHME